MKIKDYLPSGEKGFRSRIYLSGQAKKANAINGAMEIWDLLNTDVEEGISLVTATGWYPLELCDVHGGFFLDGAYGYKDPDEKLFFKVEDYGKTWAAVKTNTIMYEEDWQKINAVQEVLKRS